MREIKTKRAWAITTKKGLLLCVMQRKIDAKRLRAYFYREDSPILRATVAYELPKKK